MTARQRCRLFAGLLKEEWWRRHIVVHGGRDYYAFLRKQRQHHDAYCPYSAAIRMISGDAR